MDQFKIRNPQTGVLQVATEIDSNRKMIKTESGLVILDFNKEWLYHHPDGKWYPCFK